MEVPGIMIYPSFKVIWEMLMKVFWDDKKRCFSWAKKDEDSQKNRTHKYNNNVCTVCMCI